MLTIETELTRLNSICCTQICSQVSKHGNGMACQHKSLYAGQWMLNVLTFLSYNYKNFNSIIQS